MSDAKPGTLAKELCQFPVMLYDLSLLIKELLISSLYNLVKGWRYFERKGFAFLDYCRPHFRRYKNVTNQEQAAPLYPARQV
jgi:hypothetical protein